MKISNLLTDDAVLVELGQRIARHRLALQYTQADVAEQSGVAKRTVERIEAGGSTQVLSLIRILRSLDLLTDLDRIIPEGGPRPMERLKQQGKERQRASSRRHPDQQDRSDQAWTWDDK